MRMLLLAVLVLFNGLAAEQDHPGAERWSVKTSGPDGTAVQQVAIADLLALPDAPGVTHNDPRFETKRIPGNAGDKLHEGQLITTTAWLHLVASEGDGDYHIQVSSSADSGDHCLIVEVPNPDPQFTKTAELQPKFSDVRAFIKTKLLAGKEPSASGSVMQHAAFVTVTGVLFYDDAHVGDPPRGKKDMHAATLWELHPVTAIAFAPPPK